MVTLFDEDNTGYISYTGDVSLSSNTWTHVAFTYDGSGSTNGIKIYKNSVLMSDSDVDSDVYTSMVNTSGGYRIGRGSQGGWSNFYWTGRIKESILHNKELSLAEVQSIYNGILLGPSTTVVNHQLYIDTDDSGPNNLDGVNTDITFPVPQWETYTGQIAREWRWVQVREVK